MELTAALRACEAISGPLHIVSDSTYVVKCWHDRWWEGWIRRGWKNAAKKPIANRDLWEQLVPHFRDRENLSLEWVKGHSGDQWNDLADALAVGAVVRREGASGVAHPEPRFLGEEDKWREQDKSSAGKTRGRAATDSRIPVGTLLAVVGLRDRRLPGSATAAARLGDVLDSYAQMYPDLVVMTGLREGAEQLAASVAAKRGVRYAAVLPYPTPAASWKPAERDRFDKLCGLAEQVIILEKKRPADSDAMKKAIARRDGWLRSAADLAIVVTDGSDAEAEEALKRWEKAVGDDVWRLDVEL